MGTLLLSTSATAVHGQQFALKDGDTVVFYGDSITAQRLYTRDVEDFVLTRYPALHVRFVNAGVPGDSTNGGYAGTMAERVQRDVAPSRPTMITVMLGMNDGGWGQGSPEIDAAFQKGYRALLAALQQAAPGAAITLICPTPYDEITHGTEFPGYSRVIDEFAEDVSRIGDQLQASGANKILVADFHRPVVDALEQAKMQFPQLAPLIVPDRIHPAEIGHWIMATALMVEWHVNPIVSSLALDGAAGKVIDKERTSVTNLTRATDVLQWTQVDDALPLPFDFNNAMTAVLLKTSEIAKNDQLMLKIESLYPGQYALSIDAKPVATFSREELQHGINLALYKTPMMDQARGIDESEERRATLDQARFILGVGVNGNSTAGKTDAGLRQAQDEIDSANRASLKPHAHSFELRKQ